MTTLVLALCCITYILFIIFVWSLCKAAARFEDVIMQEERDWEERNC